MLRYTLDPQRHQWRPTVSRHWRCRRLTDLSRFDGCPLSHPLLPLHIHRSILLWFFPVSSRFVQDVAHFSSSAGSLPGLVRAGQTSVGPVRLVLPDILAEIWSLSSLLKKSYTLYPVSSVLALRKSTTSTNCVTLTTARWLAPLVLFLQSPSRVPDFMVRSGDTTLIVCFFWSCLYHLHY